MEKALKEGFNHDLPGRTQRGNLRRTVLKNHKKNAERRSTQVEPRRDSPDCPLAALPPETTAADFPCNEAFRLSGVEGSPADQPKSPEESARAIERRASTPYGLLP